MNRITTHCAACGAPLANEAKFCPNCGSPAGRPEPSPGACTVCGHVNKREGTFCEECGARLAVASDGGATADLAGARSGRPTPGSPPFRREPWHAVAAVILAGVIALFVWLESGRVPPPAKPSTPAATTPPAEPAPAPPPGLARLEAAVAADPSDTASVLALANMLHDLSRQDPSRIDAAIAQYTRYLGMRPGDPDARVDLGIMYFEKARVDTGGATLFVDRAVEEMERVARGFPAHQPAAFNLAIVNLNAGRSDEALRWFRRTVEIAPTSDLGRRAARLLEQHGGAPPPR
jgi:RNA polymerase subunit RPABC4/transcription elongation factor Spt4